MACAVGVALALAGCGNIEPDDGRVHVVVGLYPLAFLVERIGGDLVDVENLTKPGAEPHDLELTAQQVGHIAKAHLAVYEATLQPAVDAAIAEAKPAHALDVTTIVPLQPLATDSDDEHADEEADTHGLDPHIWLSPLHMVEIAVAITDQLVAIDPEHEHTYVANRMILVGDLTNLDGSYFSELRQCERTDFITTHAAFGYLAQRYGLTQVPIAGLSPDAEPSPDRVAEIHKIAQDTGITTIFFETLASPALAATIAEDLGLRTDVLDPLEGITDDSRGTDYLSVMYANLQALKEANGCQ